MYDFLLKRLMGYCEKPTEFDLKKYRRGDAVDDEAFCVLAEGFMDFYEKREALLIKNIRQIYELTDFEMGYDALNRDWKKWLDIHKERDPNYEHRSASYYTDAIIASSIKEKIFCAIMHCYQESSLGKHGSYKHSFIGCLIVVGMSYDIDESEKRDKLDLVVDYRIDICISSHDHQEHEISE